MNTTHANLYFQNTSIRINGMPMAAFPGAVNFLRRLTAAVKQFAETSSVDADEKARKKSLAIYRRNLASLPSGIFRFETGRDDIFSRTDG